MRATLCGRVGALCLSILAAAAFPAAAGATATQPEIATAIEKGVEYARTQQDPTTGEPGQYAHEVFGGEAIASGFAAAGVSAADVRTGSGPSLQDFLLGEDADFWAGGLTALADSPRLTLSAYSAGLDPARISAELNLPAQIAGRWNPAAGSFGQPPWISSDATAILAMRTSALPAWALAPALAYLRANQHPDGGWSFEALGAGEESEPETTAVAVGALCDSGVPAYDPDVEAGLSYLHGLLAEASGAIAGPVAGENIRSTSWTVDALEACGIDPQSAEWTTATEETPLDHILSLQSQSGGEAGGFGYASAAETPFVFATAEAIQALSGAGFIVAPAARAEAGQPTVRPAPVVAAGTPVPHVLAIQLAPGNVRICKVTAAAEAPLTAVLAAAQAGSVPAGCVTSFAAAGGKVTSIDGVSPSAEDESWLLRLDRGAEAAAGEQPVAFGDVVSLRLGATPAAGSAGGEPVVGPAGPAGATGAAGPVGATGASGTTGTQGKQGKRGKRGQTGKSGRRAKAKHKTKRVCTASRKRTANRKARCVAKPRRARRVRPLTSAKGGRL
jgi:hypothetical protein